MKILKNLSKWQNYVHYLVLTLAIFGIHKLSEIYKVEPLVKYWWGWVVLFLFYTIGIFLADTIIHIIFASLPKKYRWSD